MQLGLQILDGAIWEQINAGNHVTVFGYSQSAVIASLEMQHLISLGPNAPSPSQLNFILIGNEMNPNGGILARIPGLNVTTLGLPFYGATPDNPYPTTTYTLEYDGFADFPRYPLNVLSDINAVFGILTVHTTYADLTPAQIASATQLPTQGTTSNTYYIIETEHLPLLAPLRAIPVIGPPLAALVEPNLEVIVNLGYGDPRFGYSTSPANVPTPFGLFPDVPASVVADALVAGTQQGVNDFMVELPAALNTLPQTPMPAFPPYVPTLLPPPPPPQPATLINIADTFASVVSTGYSILLPTADLGLAFVTILPAYDLTLFVNQLAAGNLRAAIELPLAATIGLAALGGMIEFIAVVVGRHYSATAKLQHLIARCSGHSALLRDHPGLPLLEPLPALDHEEPVFDDAGCCWHQSIGKANGGRHWVWGSPRWVSMGSLVRMRRLGATGQGQPVGAVAQRELRAENRPKSRPQFTLGARLASPRQRAPSVTLAT